MIRQITLKLLIIFLIGACTPKKTEKFDLLILNASIVDIENGTVLTNQLVGVSADTIRVTREMSSNESFKGNEIIDAQGNFLMPGLWDRQRRRAPTRQTAVPTPGCSLAYRGCARRGP